MYQSSLDTLLDQWNDAHDRGLELTAAELCQSRPELVAELARQIEELRGMTRLVHQVDTPTIHAAAQTVADVTPSGRRVRPTVPGYEILRELGRGGMGVVYLAREAETGRLVALKVMLEAARAGREGLHQFRQEAQALARLDLPGVVRIHGLGEADSGTGVRLPYISMEYVAGGSLADALAARRLSPWDAAALVERLARTVQAIHDRGIVHRDIKPANVLLHHRTTNHTNHTTEDNDSRSSFSSVSSVSWFDCLPKLTDFGLAKRLDRNDSTASGMIVGTPSYMSPEQADGRSRDVGTLADVWGLGAILYECLAGGPAFLGDSPLETMQHVRHREPVAPRRRNRGCPRSLEAVALKCLCKDPAGRYPSAAALADDLSRAHGGQPIAAVRQSWLGRLCGW